MTDLIAELGKYREKDEKTPQGEVIQDKETLNFSRVRKFLKDRNITEDNFDTLFKLPTALQILKAGGTRGEQEMIRTITEGQNYLTKIGEPELIERESLESFSSTAKKELIRRNELEKLPLLEDSFRAYDTVRLMARRSLKTRKKIGEEREAQKVSVEKGIQESFAGVVDDVKKNYDKMAPGEKAIAVGGLLIGAIMLFTSGNEHVTSLKNKLWSVAKAVGLGVGANYIFKLFTGKTAIDTAADWTKKTVGRDGFWQETYKTDAEKAAILQKSVVYMGNKDFLDLAGKYRTAKSAVPPEKKIQVPGVVEKQMTPEEVYTALDVFFSKYPVADLEKRYRNASPPLNWDAVVSAQMTEDGSIKMDDNLASRTVDNVKEYSIRGWNALWVTEAGLGLNRYLYKKIWGKDPTDQEIKTQSDKLREHLKDEVNTENELDAYFERHMSEQPLAKNFKLMRRGNKRDQNDSSIAFMEVPNDSIYLMSEARIDPSITSAEKAGEAMVFAALQRAENFLKRKYPEIGDNLYRFIDIERMWGVRVAENDTFKLFIHMPIKGNPEFSRRSVMLPSADEKAKPGTEVFGLKDRIEFSGLAPDEQEHFRVRFMLDATQSAEINKICLWYTDYYKTRGLSRTEVVRLMLEDDNIRQKALEQTAIKQNLKANDALLSEREKELGKIEQTAASDFEGKEAFKVLQSHMRKNGGYKIRLAILGDDSARSHFIAIDASRYDPAQDKGWIDNLIKYYRKNCEKIVEDYKKGVLKFS